MSSPTLVIALFDLATREPWAGRPTPSELLDRNPFWMALDVDLLCFTEPAIEREVIRRRQPYELADRTEIISCPLEALDCFELLPTAERARDRHPLLNGHLVLDTPLRAVAGWSKLELLPRALEANPFNTDHFIWVELEDFDRVLAGHVGGDRVFVDPPAAVKLLQVSPLDPGLPADRDHHLSYRREHFATSFMAGPARHLREMCEIAQAELREALMAEFAPLDEHLVEAVAARRPELFDLYHGGREFALENYRLPRGSADNLASQLRAWRVREQWQPAAGLAERIIDSISSGSFVSAPDALASLLEECFLVSYYSEGEGKPQARSCAALYAELAHQDPAFRDEFLLHEIRVRTNFGFVEQGI
jgi:hypothetical protein